MVDEKMNARINALRQLLKKTESVAVDAFEGFITQESYREIKVQRSNWREELKFLEKNPTQEEIDAWEKEHPILSPPLSPTDLLEKENQMLRAQVQAASERQDFVEDCIAEMAAQVYSV